MSVRLDLSALDVPGPDASTRGCSLIRGITARFGAGRLVAVIGPNGAGKSTLLRAIAGLLPIKGEIRINGVLAQSLSRMARARAIAYLPQGHEVHWPLKLRDVVALGRFPHGLNDPRNASARDTKIIDEAMARTDVLGLADRPIHALSGGERARAMIARVFAVEAPVLLADEPMAALDPRHQLTIFQSLRDEAQRGALVLVVTHDLGLASRFADEVLLLHRGDMVGHDVPGAILNTEILSQIYGIRAHHFEHDGAKWLVPWEIT